MFKQILFVVSALAYARAQIPSLGWCPDYAPMSTFDMTKFMGIWYESARYFQLIEVGSRCVMANYTLGPDGKLSVSNEVTNRLTGIKRVFNGEIKPQAIKAHEGKIHVKYTLPFIPDVKYTVLDTDYKNYAVLWSCSGIGPLSSQNAWLMTRERKPSEKVLQMAYGVLDKYKISKTFFLKSDQEDCALLDLKPETAAPAENPENEEIASPIEEAENTSDEVSQNGLNQRSEYVPDVPAVVVQTRNAELAEKEAIKEAAPSVINQVSPQTEEKSAPMENKPEMSNDEPMEQIKAAEMPKPAPVAEVIMKTAGIVKETVKEPSEDVKQFQPFEALQEALANPAAQIQQALAKPVAQFQEAFANPIAQVQQAFAKPVAQIQEAFSRPLAQIQDTFSRPLQNIQQAFNRPVDKVPEATTKPLDDVQAPIVKPEVIVKEPVMTPAAPVVPASVPEMVMDKETMVKEPATIKENMKNES